jgi:hypothetical protein
MNSADEITRQIQICLLETAKEFPGLTLPELAAKVSEQRPLWVLGWIRAAVVPLVNTGRLEMSPEQTLSVPYPIM